MLLVGLDEPAYGFIVFGIASYDRMANFSRFYPNQLPRGQITWDDDLGVFFETARAQEALRRVCDELAAARCSSGAGLACSMTAGARRG